MKKIRNEVPEAMARAAAHWWAERADGTAHHNNRGGDLASVFAGLLADTMNEPPKVGALERFEEILAEKIMTAEYRMARESIWVDYAPDRILAEAAEEAGMYIDPEKGEITVRIALGQPKKIYPEVA